MEEGQGRNPMTLPIRSFLLAALLTATTGLADVQAESRMWTSKEGKSIQAELVDVLNGEAVLKLNGQPAPVRVPFARLSAADQEYIKTWKKPEPAVGGKPGDDKAKPGGPGKTEPALDASGFPIGSNSTVKRDEHGWPEVVALKEKPAFIIVKEDKVENEFIYRSDHFEFISTQRLSGEIVREFSRLFETAFETAVALPLRLDPKPPAGFFRVKLYDSMGAYLAAGGLSGSAGMYTGRTKEVMVPLPSLGVKKIGQRWVLEDRDGNHTLIHEVLHQVMHDWLPRLPVWMIEGAAEYVTAGRYGNGRLTLRGYGRKLEEYKGGGSEVKTADLEKLMAMDHETWINALSQGGASRNYRGALLLFYFFCHQDGDETGKNVIDYFQARKGKRGDDKEECEKFLLRGRDVETLQKDFKRGLAKIGIRLG